MRTALIVNIRSRRGQKFFFEACDLLEARGIVLHHLYPVIKPEKLLHAVRRAVELGAKRIVVGSGDGTLASVAGLLAHSDIELGILPFGTSNNFARTLGIPRTLEGAVGVIAKGNIRRIPLGKVNERYFLNVCSLGLSGALAHYVPHALKYYIGRLAYALTGIWLLFTYKPKKFHIFIDGKEETLVAHEIVVANGRYHAGVEIEPKGFLRKPYLSLFTLGGTSRFSLFKTLLAMMLRRHKTLPEMKYEQIEHAKITVDAPHYLEIDGEVGVFTKAEFSVEDTALTVLAP